MFERYVRYFFAVNLILPLMGSASLLSEDTVEFLSDYNTAIREARASGRPIFLEFRCAP